MTSPRLEERIKKLSAKALRAELDQLQSALQELRAALHEYDELLRQFGSVRLLPRPTPPISGILKTKNDMQ